MALTFNPLPAFYGLTNQAISYAGALRYAMDEGRALLFPNHMTNKLLIQFHLLFNATLAFSILRELPNSTDLFWAIRSDQEASVRKFYASSSEESYQQQQQHLQLIEKLLRVVPDSAFPFVSMNKKNWFLPNRDSYRGDPSTSAVRGAAIYMKLLHAKAARYNFTRHHNFFGRFPWAAVDGSSASPRQQESFFLNALQPVESVENAWFALATLLQTKAEHSGNEDEDGGGGAGTAASVNRLDVLNFVRRNVTAVHFRIEQDAALLLDVLPSQEAVSEWLFNFVAAAVKSADVLTLWLCLGAWPSVKFEKDLITYTNTLCQMYKRHRKTVLIYWRSKLIREAQAAVRSRVSQSDMLLLKELDNLPTAVGEQRGIHRSKAKSTQDHFLSFVDLLFLSRAHAAVLSGHSSLKFLVFARRCYGSDVTANEMLLRRLEQLVPEWQRWWWSSGDAEAGRVHTFAIDKLTGRMDAPTKLLCNDRASGWAGHKYWN